MKFDDYLKEEMKTWSLWDKFTWWFDLVPLRYFRKLTGVCPHEGVFGAVGAKEDYCLDCGRTVPNPEWKADRRTLKLLEREEKLKELEEGK